MTSIVAAGFDSFPAAESAAHALFADGFHEEAVDIFRFDDSPDYAGPAFDATMRRMVYAAVAGSAVLAMAGAAAGTALALLADASTPFSVGAAAVGACAGALISVAGIVMNEGYRASSARQPRSVVLVAVLAEAGQEAQSAQLLRDAGGIGIQRMRSRWLNGRWAGFDPLHPSRMRGDIPIE